MKSILLFIIIINLSTISIAQTNPFLSSGSAEESAIETVEITPDGPSTWPIVGTLIRNSAAAQKKLQNSIANTMLQVNTNGSLKNLWLLILFSFVFGILHAMGPGHRKAILVTYFLGEGTKPIKGVITGFLLAIVHAISAILLVGGFYLFTTRSLLISVNQAQSILFPLTYGIIFLLGLWLIFHGVKDFNHSNENKKKKNRGLGGLILSGLVPCPAASAIMILAVASKAAKIGILSVIFMSLGMGVLLAAVALLTILMRTRMTALFQDNTKGKKLEFTLQLFSGITMALFGLFMVMGNL